ncbi:MAG TPA: glycerophosphodiester phosphodiesterase [Bryobacteraceae bacterium]|nr:glycerophosphodiester phosphodiesterase [Bryobacteraceae bacterium]
MHARFLFLLLCGLPLMGGAVKVQGHRGARAVLPENTMPAFEYAIREGVDVLELDLAVTKDDVLVVSHDPHVNPVICSGPNPGVAIRTLTLAELRQYDCGSKKNPEFPNQKPVQGTRIPTLDEVFALAPKGSFEFNVETKISPAQPELTPTPERFAELLLAAIRKYRLEKRVVVQSFDFRTLHAMAQLAPEIRLSALFFDKSKSFVEFAKEAGSKIVSPHYSVVTKAEVDAAHKAGLTIVPWTANTPDVWQKLVDAGVDEIISDDPAALKAWLKARS